MKYKIFVCHSCNSSNVFIKNDIYQNVVGGACFDNGILLSNKYFVGDNTGENISNKNKRFNELTVQYWAWKNTNYDYYGFCHYRRYFVFNDNFQNFKYSNQSDLFLDSINKKTIDLCGLTNKQYIDSLIENFDLITVLDTKLNGLTIETEYSKDINQDSKDFVTAIKILKRLHPKYSKYADKIIKSNKCKFLNMYIMSKKLMDSYFSWLFPILFELEKQVDYKDSSLYHSRTVGLIAERLFNIYLLYLENEHKEIRIKEIRNTFFKNTDEYIIKPAFKEKNGIVLVAGDCNCQYLATTIQSIIETSSFNNTYDILVFIDDLSFYNKNLIFSMIKGRSNFRIRFIYINDYLIDDLVVVNHVKKPAYARFAIFDYFENFERILYLDVDLLIFNDISKIFKTNLHNKLIGAVKCTINNSWTSMTRYGHHNEGNRLKEDLKIKNPFNYFNAGVVLYDVKNCLKNKINTKYLFDLAKKLKIVFMDQDVLNYVFYNKTFFLDNKWNVLIRDDVENKFLTEYSLPEERLNEYIESTKNPYIVHYAGRHIPTYNHQAKFWKEFWLVGSKTPFYPQLIVDYVNSFNSKQSLFKKIINCLFPKNSKRRHLLKSFAQKDKSKLVSRLLKKYRGY